MENAPLVTSNSNNQKQQLALRVALDTMKDRCILQQKRLSDVEEENQQLRERLTQNTKSNNNTTHSGSGVAENFQLRLQVSELQRQNVQLNAHINMVSAENRKLWQRLSQMAKDQNKPGKDKDETLKNTSGVSIDEVKSPCNATSGGGYVNQNLIRSKTFTQRNPNPNLRHNILTPDNCGSTELLDVSLESDVPLEVFGDESNRRQSDTDMGLGYLNVYEALSASPQEQDFNMEAHKCMEGLQEMRREAITQRQELNSVFALLESRIALQPCPECVKKSNKPEMADKSLETDESLTDATKNSANTSERELNIYTDSTAKAIPLIQNNHLNVLPDQILANENNMCPMCGKIYSSQVTFESFCEHVEEHFRDENIQDIDNSMEHFELLSHPVGNF